MAFVSIIFAIARFASAQSGSAVKASCKNPFRSSQEYFFLSFDFSKLFCASASSIVWHPLSEVFPSSVCEKRCGGSKKIVARKIVRTGEKNFMLCMYIFYNESCANLVQ